MPAMKQRISFFGESRTPEKPVEIVSSAHNDQDELNKMNKSVAPDVWIPITHLGFNLGRKILYHKV